MPALQFFEGELHFFTAASACDADESVSTGGELSIKSQREENGQLLFSVSDTGVGLPADKVDAIFDAFFKTKPEGTGMGLRISRSIIETHGGRLWASSGATRGATFHFTLPIDSGMRAPAIS